MLRDAHVDKAFVHGPLSVVLTLVTSLSVGLAGGDSGHYMVWVNSGLSFCRSISDKAGAWMAPLEWSQLYQKICCPAYAMKCPHCVARPADD